MLGIRYICRRLENYTKLDNRFFSDVWLIFTMLTCILGASLSLFGYLNDSYIKPKQKLREENKKMEEEKNTLMDDLEKEAVRRKQKDRLQQN